MATLEHGIAGSAFQVEVEHGIIVQLSHGWIDVTDVSEPEFAP